MIITKWEKGDWIGKAKCWLLPHCVDRLALALDIEIRGICFRSSDKTSKSLESDLLETRQEKVLLIALSFSARYLMHGSLTMLLEDVRAVSSSRRVVNCVFCLAFIPTIDIDRQHMAPSAGCTAAALGAGIRRRSQGSSAAEPSYWRSLAKSETGVAHLPCTRKRSK